MSGAIQLPAEALILGSGPINPAADHIIQEALKPFVHQILEVQRIDLAGRTIVAMLISLDPAHLRAIANELDEAGLRANLDIAIEIQ